MVDDCGREREDPRRSIYLFKPLLSLKLVIERQCGIDEQRAAAG